MHSLKPLPGMATGNLQRSQPAAASIMDEDSDCCHVSLPTSAASTPMQAFVVVGEVTVRSTARGRHPLGNVNSAKAAGCLGELFGAKSFEAIFRKEPPPLAVWRLGCQCEATSVQGILSTTSRTVCSAVPTPEGENVDHADPPPLRQGSRGPVEAMRRPWACVMVPTTRPATVWCPTHAGALEGRAHTCIN
jgi:hypothetical protein